MTENKAMQIRARERITKQQQQQQQQKIDRHYKRFECTETNIAIYGGDQIQ